MHQYRFPTALEVALLTAVLLSLSSASAVNLNSAPPPDAASPAQALDLATYRSASNRHKVRVEGSSGEVPKNSTATRVLDYGSFQILEVDRAAADRLLSTGGAANADAQNLVLLNTGALDTTSANAAELGTKSLAVTGGKQLHLVQFPGPIKPQWMTLLEATGVQVVTPIPNNAYLVYGDDRALNGVVGLATAGLLQWQAAYLPQYKLQPGTELPESATQLKSLALKPPVGPNDLYVVQLVRDSAVNALTETFLRDIAGSRPPLSRYEILSYVNLVVQIPAGLLFEAAKRPDVVSIARYIEPTRMDERQNMIMAGNLTGNAPNAGNYLTILAGWGFTQAQFNASAFVVDVADDGADRNPGAVDPGAIPQDANSAPFNPRHFVFYEGGSKANATRFYYKSRWGTGATADAGLGLAGHGQLNMSIIGGFVPDSFDSANTRVHRDTQGFRYGLGVAPFVRLGNSVIFDKPYTSPAFPAMLSGGYGSGARISSNSWGAPVNGAYTADTQAYDALVRDSQSATAGNQPMIIVFAAGNYGPGSSTTISPGTGKNVITVGATENARSHSEVNGGDVGNTAGADGIGITDVGADSANDMATFSSRGPTSDGRRKPDIVAPGTHVTGISFVAASADALSPVNGLGAADAGFRADGVSAMPNKATVFANKFFPVLPAQRWYTTSSGTSHATPAVAGGAALVYQQFLNNPAYLATNRTPPGSAPPSPALVKAYLANAARYMNGVGANDTLPSNNQGMGAVNLGTAFDGVQRITRDQVVSDRFNATGQFRTFFATVTNASAPLRVTLAYTDVPGPTSGNAFINDLDLRVTVNGSTYLGNMFSGATSVTGGVADTRNNLESVFLPAGLAVGTTLKIQVRASNIAGVGDPTVVGNNQDFALVVYNAAPAPDQAMLALASTSLPTGNGTIEPNECNDLNVTLSNEGSAGATAINATLATSTAGITIAQAGSAYPNIAAAANGVNVTAFKISTAPSVACASIINLSQTINFTGGASPVSFPLSFIVGTPAIAFSQNFDAAATPTLPLGWTTAQTGTTPPAFWATTAINPDSAPNTAFTNGSTSVATNSLISPSIPLPASPTGAVLTFRHAWNFESGGTTALYDGGILELSTDGGTTYNNVTSPAVGGTFTAGGYNGTIAPDYTNPIAGQSAWGGAQGTFVTSTLVLPIALNGQIILLRWRAGWDSDTAYADPNWRIDSISLQAGYSCAAASGGVCIAPIPPNLAYTPAASNTVSFTGVTVPGSTGNGSIAVTPSGGGGAGGAATSTINGCTVTGANAASFAGAGTVNLSFVGATNTAQNISLTCTSSSSTRVATLNCNETRGSSPLLRTWPLSCPVGCSLDINGDLAVTADKDAVLLNRYLLGFRGASLIANVPLGAGRANATAVEAFIGSATQFDIFARPVAVTDAFTEGLVLTRLMLGFPNSALFTGITVPTGAGFNTPATVRANVNARCGTTF